jgi:MFS family permease
MQIHWLLLTLALVLLFYPLDMFLKRHVRLSDFEHMRNRRTRGRRAWWRQSWVWVDPARAFTGAWVLRSAWIVDPPVDGPWYNMPAMATLTTLAVLVLALGCQMYTRRDEVLFAPVGFCAGLLFAVMPPQVAVLVLALALTCLMAFRGWSAYFIAGALAAGLLGLALMRLDFWILAPVVLLLEPYLVSWVAKRELLVPIR